MKMVVARQQQMEQLAYLVVLLVILQIFQVNILAIRSREHGSVGTSHVAVRTRARKQNAAPRYRLSMSKIIQHNLPTPLKLHA